MIFDRDFAVEPGIARLDNDTHASAADEFQHVVFTQPTVGEQMRGQPEQRQFKVGLRVRNRQPVASSVWHSDPRPV